MIAKISEKIVLFVKNNPKIWKSVALFLICFMPIVLAYTGLLDNESLWAKILITVTCGASASIALWLIVKIVLLPTEEWGQVVSKLLILLLACLPAYLLVGINTSMVMCSWTGDGETTSLSGGILILTIVISFVALILRERRNEKKQMAEKAENL